MRLCVFLGSSPGRLPIYAAAARSFGTLLAARGIGLVYGGGSVGLMGVLADAVLAAGGEAIGVIPDALQALEVDHPRLTALHVVRTMHERKALMAELADGFIAMPGGIGTFEELFEVWTWAQLGYHNKPCGLLDVNGFYRGMAGFIDHVVAEGFLKPAQREMLLVDDKPERLLDRMLGYHETPHDKWISIDDL
jgi:uncharacterized protein (TIGR00730 family)